jgi:hypothetical protein
MEVGEGEAGAVFSEWECGSYGGGGGVRLGIEAGREMGIYSVLTDGIALLGWARN